MNTPGSSISSVTLKLVTIAARIRSLSAIQAETPLLPGSNLLTVLELLLNEIDVLTEQLAKSSRIYSTN